jgi:inorganic pyrophosphatase
MDKVSSTFQLPPFREETQLVNIVIDTPKAAPFKLKFDEKARVFLVHKAMPLGFVFPFNFGFLPSTRGGDGDPLDVLLLTDFILPIGAVILGKLVAVLEAEQTDRKGKQRNDRLIAIPVEVTTYQPMLPVVEFDRSLKKAVSEFFVKYNELQGRTFRPLRYAGPSRAIRLVRKACLALY